MEKKIITFITLLIVLVGLPYIIYTLYINHQDDLMTSMKEFASYTTVDEKYDVKVMEYRGVTGGEEMYNFKFYIVDKEANKNYFIKSQNVSTYGTNIKFVEDKDFGKYDVKIMIKTASKSDVIIVDMNELRVKGQKVRGVF